MDIVDQTFDAFARASAKPKGKNKRPKTKKPKAKKPKPKGKKRTAKRPAKPKVKKAKVATVVRSERLDMRLSKVEKAKVVAKAKKLRRTVTSLIVEAIEKIK